MAKIVTTGGAGFIGSHLTDRLIKAGHQVTVIDNLSTGKEENLNPQADFHNLDICDFDKIKPLFEGIDFVFHLAAIVRVPVSVKDPIKTSQVNIVGTISVFKAAIDGGAKRVISASSSSVYGDQEKLPLREDMLPNPVSPYGCQKMAGEGFARLFTDLYKVPIISLRYFNVYGPRFDFSSEYSLVIGKFLRQQAEGKPLTVFGDGEQTRGFCYIDDVVEANLRAMESDKLEGGEVINIGSKDSQTVNYLAELIGGEVQHLPPRPGDVLHTKADMTRSKNLLDWQPTVSFEEGLMKAREWFNKTL